MHFGLVGEPDNHDGLLVYMISQHLTCQADPKLEMKYALLPKYFFIKKMLNYPPQVRGNLNQ